MITPGELIAAYARNLKIIEAQTNGLTHSSAAGPGPFPCNCLNWLLGHIAETRTLVLQKLGHAGILSEAQAKRYGYGSDPVLADGEDVIKLDELLDLLRQSQESIAAGLGGISEETLAGETESFLGTTSLGQLLFFLHFHETYHLGQTELLRQLAGTDDEVL